MNKLKLHPETYEELSKLDQAMINELGQEVLNPKPKVLHVGHRPPSLKEQIQRLIRQEVSLQAMNQGHETWDEANDLDVPDDEPMPGSQYEMMMEEFIPDLPSSAGNPKQPPDAVPSAPPPDPGPTAEPVSE